MTPREFLERKISGMLDTVLHRDGFTVPFYCTSIAANGSVSHVRIDAGSDGSSTSAILASHVEQDAFPIPVYFVFTQGGKFVVFSVAAPDEQPREMEYIM